MGARLVNNNRLIASTAVITASGSATGYPASNLGSSALWRKWRSPTGTGDQWVKFDTGTNFSLQVFAAMQVKLHTGGTLNVQANATDSWGAPTVNLALTMPSPNFTGVLATWLTTPVALRWVRFYFTNTGAVNDYVEIGVALAGSYLEPKMSIAPGLGVFRRDPSVQRVAIGGQRSSIVRPKYHEVSGQFRLQTASARDDFRTVFESNGSSVPVLLAVAPGIPGLTFYGTLTTALEPVHRASSGDLWDIPFRFLEDVP